MRTARVLGLILVAVAIAGVAGVAQADSIGPDCGTCQGGVYTLTYDPTPESTFVSDGTDGGTLGTTYSIYDVTLTIDSSGYIGGGTYINSVAIKPTSTEQNTALGSGLDSAPGTLADWTYQTGGLNASGCDGAGSGFACAEDGTTAPVPNGTYSWTFDVLVADGTLLTDSSSIKVQYVDDNGNKIGALVSEDITLQPVPEPATLLLIGTGLVGLGAAGRKRFLKRRSS